MTAALEGGLTVAKVAHDEAVADGRAVGDDEASLVRAMGDIAAAGAEMVVLTRGSDSALALVEGTVLEVVGPRVEPFDHRGAGDSLTAGVAAGLAAGREPAAALRLGAAAGALNVTRRGLGTGTRHDIERMAELVTVRRFTRRRNDHR
jgi:1-phosphofructokinase